MPTKFVQAQYRIGTESEIYTDGKLRAIHTENKIKCVLKMPLSLYICYLLDRLEPIGGSPAGGSPWWTCAEFLSPTGISIFSSPAFSTCYIYLRFRMVWYVSTKELLQATLTHSYAKKGKIINFEKSYSLSHHVWEEKIGPRKKGGWRCLFFNPLIWTMVGGWKQEEKKT